MMESQRFKGLTLAEQFTRTFDVHSLQAAAPPPNLPSEHAGSVGMTSGSIYGFGSACLRFQNEIYPSDLNYGKSNKAVIELNPPEPVAIDTLNANAPSRMLPEFAAFFSPEMGCNFCKGPNRAAPPGPGGEPRFWVQPKDAGGVFPSPYPPDIFSMAAPRGTGDPTTRHEVPQYLMTPAERREALVFDKSHDRARRELRKAANDACQLTISMQKRYPNGVIGLEGPNCPDSIIYRIPHEKKCKVETAKARHAVGRLENLRLKRDTPLPYNILHHDPSNAEEEHIFARKAKTLHSASDRQLNHYELRPSGKTVDAGFRSNQEKTSTQRPAGLRSQQLLHESTGGRSFNLISGVELPYPASSTSASHGIDRRAHPSNLSMPKRFGTSSTLVGPIPDAHQSEWKPTSPMHSSPRGPLNG